ncbi:MAG: amino acid permease [Xanthomonadales bacterium]|nr:amino acid permease [Xanthomonadales bacterium]
MTDAANRSPTSRTLGPWRSWALVVGGAIGSAVFMMPAILVPFGTIGLLSLAAGGIGALFVALTLGNLARRITATGGPYAYARAAFGDFGGFLVAWCFWISMWTACAGMAVGFAAYLGALVPAVADSPALSIAAALSITWLVVATNVAGVRESGIFGLVTTLLKLLPLILIGTIGLWFVDADTLPPLNPGGGSMAWLFASAFALTFWNYVGIEAATVPAEDVVQPDKTVPRALIFGTLTVMFVYLLVAFVVMGVIPAAELAQSGAPLAEAGTRIAGYWGGAFVTAGAVVSIGGCLNVTVLCAGQSAMAASRDRVFPAVFERLGKRGTPAASYIIVGVLVSAMVLVNYTRGMVAAYTFIVMVSTLTIVVPYAFSAMAALLLDVHDRAADRARAGQEPVYWVFLLLIGGIPVYVVVTRRNDKLQLN